MADLHHERVRAYFDEPDMGRLAVGQDVLIRWDAKPGREWHGHIARLPVTVVTYTTRNVGEVLVDIDDAEDGLLPDTNVTVKVTISSEPNALSMPREALHEQNGKYFVYKVVTSELEARAGHDRISQSDSGFHSLRSRGWRYGGHRNNQRAALAGGRTDQGRTVSGLPVSVRALAGGMAGNGHGNSGMRADSARDAG